MNYYLDTEFNGIGGRLISLALVREDGHSIYVVGNHNFLNVDKWVVDNVVSVLGRAPCTVLSGRKAGFGRRIDSFLSGDDNPVVHVDWPDDIKYFCESVITGPGEMIDVPALSFVLHRIDSYPTDLDGAIQHNAWWDAMALRYKLTGRVDYVLNRPTTDEGKQGKNDA